MGAVERQLRVGDVIVLLDPNEEEVGRAPATMTKHESKNGGLEMEYIGAVVVTPEMVGREVTQTRLITPLFAVTKDVAGVLICEGQTTVTVVQKVNLDMGNDAEAKRMGRRWWNRL